MVIDTQKQQFAKFWDYEAELKRSNPHTTTEIVTIPNLDGILVFDKFYVCFESLRMTWINNCWPIIGLDGAFMKWELKGEVLAAVGRDSDNRIYPIAWGWSDLDLGLGNGFTIISDKQKRLINIVAEILPNAEHHHCARHIFANWKKIHGKSEFETYFWRVTYNFTIGDYEYNMEKLKKQGQQAYEDLLKTIGAKIFSRTMQDVRMCATIYQRALTAQLKKP